MGLPPPALAAGRPPNPATLSFPAMLCRWFHFRLTGARGVPLTLHIVNAGRSSFPEAWPGYQACCSSDYQHWFRVRTSYDAAAGVLTIHHTPEHDIVFFAYFAPFPLMRHQMLVAGLASQRPDLVRCEVLGQTLDGRDLDLLTLGGWVGGWVPHLRAAPVLQHLRAHAEAWPASVPHQIAPSLSSAIVSCPAWRRAARGRQEAGLGHRAAAPRGDHV
jgi:hypothetical protein